METRILLTVGPKEVLPENLKKLLWIVRLRSFIRDKQYRDALRYLRAVPLTALKPSERRVFEADGSEIIYGIIHEHYLKGEYSNIVRVWNLYKDSYIAKVANDPYINFVVGQSYLKLGLYKGFEKQYARFKKLNDQPIKTFPYWVDRVELGNKTAILKELSVIKNIRLENWDLAYRELEHLKKAKIAKDRYAYYIGIIHFQKKSYKDAMNSFEDFLSSQKRDMELDPNDLANLIRYYTDSIYELGLLDKYQEVSKAILADTERFSQDNKYLKDVLERLEYMNIEILAGKSDKSSYMVVENKINQFLQKYKEPKNYGRIRYLLGHSYVKNMKLDEGQEVLQQLLEDEKISDYIKELAKSELSLIAIKKRTL
jgi:tetratricopeptide (TPR) repeat protein